MKLSKVLNPFNWGKKETIYKLTDTDLYNQLGGYDSYTGKVVNAETMLYSSAMWSGIRLIAETVGTLPIHLYKRTENGRVKDKEHPLYDRFHSQPNRYESDIEFKEQIAMALIIFGTGYFKQMMFGDRGVFTFKHNNNVHLKTDRTDPYYLVTENGQTKEYSFDEIVRVKGFGGLGELEGSKTYKFSKHTVALALAADEFGARFFGQGGRPSGILSTDKLFTEQQREDLRKAMEPMLNPTKENQGRLAVLEAGMKYTAISSTNSESQFTDVRKYQTAEAARYLRIPLWMMMEPDGSKFNNNEQGNQHFLQFTLRPYLVRIEKALNTQVLPDDMKSTHYFEFDTAPLLRPDTQTRFDVYSKARTSSIFTINEIRAMENKDPVQGGDDINAPLNSNVSEKASNKNEQN